MKGVVSDTKINGELTAKAFNDYFLNACEPKVLPISDYCVASLRQRIISRSSRFTFHMSLVKKFVQKLKN